MSSGYLRLNYDDTVTVGSDSSSTEAISRKRNLWAHDDSFTIETIITPYDVNGIGTRTASRHGVLDSTKTPPYPTDAITDRTIYESVDYLGASGYLTQKMMLFYNQYVQLYLENTTSSSYNQPAEYKIVAKLTESGGSTKTVETDTVIKASDKLTGYYDASGYYDLNSTSYQRISTAASGSNPTGTVTIDDYDDVEVNTQATGQIAITANDIANYASSIKATGSITIANQNNLKVDVTASGSTAGFIKFGAIPDSAIDSDTTEFIQVTNENGAVITKWFAIDGATNAAPLSGGSWPAGARAYTRSTSATQIATNLAAAINTYNNGWSGSVTAGADPTDGQASPPSDSVIFTGGVAGSAPNRKGADGDITLGSGLPGGVTRVQISGGANELILGETTGSADTNINYISITDSASTTKNYFPSETNSTGSTGTRTLDNSSTVSVVYFNWSGVNQNSNCATALVAAINHANGHPSTITATANGADVNLSHDVSGTAGNSATLAKTNTADSVATISGANFTGGVNTVNGSSTPHIVLLDGAGLTKNYVPVANGDAKANGFSGTIGSVTGVAFQEGANPTATAANLETAIEHSNGHAGSITASNSSGTLTLTHIAIGTSGNQTITLTNTTGITKSDLTGGATPDNYVSIRDAAGTLKKYKAATVEVTGTTDGTYIFYRAVTDNNTTAANLETAIDGSNGHNGTLITTRTNNAVSVKLNQAAMGSAAMSDNVTDITTVNYSSANNNDISVGSGEAEDIGAGSKIYDSSVNLLGTVSSVSGDTITLATAPASSITSTVYTNQLREALYLEDMFKISLVFLKPGSIEIWMNGELLAKETHTLNSVTMHLSDCKIGRGATDGSGGNNTQFFGELYEIAMHKGKRPCATNLTLTPGYSDILFYYTFGD